MRIGSIGSQHERRQPCRTCRSWSDSSKPRQGVRGEREGGGLRTHRTKTSTTRGVWTVLRTQTILACACVVRTLMLWNKCVVRAKGKRRPSSENVTPGLSVAPRLALTRNRALPLPSLLSRCPRSEASTWAAVSLISRSSEAKVAQCLRLRHRRQRGKCTREASSNRT